MPKSFRNALFAAGAGNIGNYDNCSFSSTGTTFRGNQNSNPVVGERYELVQTTEIKIEVTYMKTFGTQCLLYLTATFMKKLHMKSII
jgi:hypothetical protein